MTYEEEFRPASLGRSCLREMPMEAVNDDFLSGVDADLREWRELPPHRPQNHTRGNFQHPICIKDTLPLSLSGVKRTWVSAPHMSAFDPKRTWLAYAGAPFKVVCIRLKPSRVYPWRPLT